MLKTGWRTVTHTVLMCVGLATVAGLGACTGSSGGESVNIDAIAFETLTVPDGGAGEFYDTVIEFLTAGRAAPPDKFEILVGELPPGVTLVADREDITGDGRPDPDGPLTGNARLVGFPRIAREGLPYNFVIKAVSTGQLSTTPQPVGAPALAAEQPFQIEVMGGTINILNPTAQEGSNDPSVPAFPDVIDFVNPANPLAFTSFPFLTAGGSGDNVMVIYMPRELELSVFDTLMPVDGTGAPILSDDTDESASPSALTKFDVDFSDGGVFNLQAGTRKVQIGGFQSPRGAVGKIDPLDPDWFQREPGALPNLGGPSIDSRRDFIDSDNIGKTDNTLGAALPIAFSDYFDARFEGTNPGWVPTKHPNDPNEKLSRRKYPFVAGEYQNAFFQPFRPGDLTPLRFNIIVEAIDRNGTPGKIDDRVARKAYVVQVRIPDIVIDSVFIPAGTAGVDYNEFVNASGGVPPLQYDLEWVDGKDDAEATDGDPLTPMLFGVELDDATGGFFGLPRAEGDVDLTVRVHAAVMNPSQDADTFVPTGGTDIDGRQNEWNGEHPLTGDRGIHKTFKVSFGMPSLPALNNPGLDPGVDGTSYKAADGSGNVILSGIGGVPLMIPYPVALVGGFPPNPKNNDQWCATYDPDDTFTEFPNAGDEPQPGVDGLPNFLTLDGGLTSTTNGEISGSSFDRGFHPVSIEQTDVFIGDATDPKDIIATPNKRQMTPTAMALSISPDQALYLRGLQAGEGGIGGGEPSGLHNPGQQTAESRMVPMMLDATLFSVNTGEDPTVDGNLPAKFDILPVAIANGGEDENVNKGIPSVSGFWPAEAGKEDLWDFRNQRAWRHSQQELNWLQMPGTEARRVFLWGQATVKQWRSGATIGMDSKRYQQYDLNGERGILILEPSSGRYWMPATFSNARGDSDGATFGAEYVEPPYRASSSYPTSYARYYYYSSVDYIDFEVHNQGLGVYLEQHSTSSASGNNWYATDLGRTAVSVAVSTDGLWCATAMPGGDTQKIAVWRTDGAILDSGFTGANAVEAVDGIDADGNTVTGLAAIINVGDGGDDADDILPDSLMFVDGGLLFMRFTDDTGARALDRIFGVSLKNGKLSEIDINDRVSMSENTDQSFGLPPFNTSSTTGYIPDQDQLRGQATGWSHEAQFAYSGAKTDAGKIGPGAVAFIAGSARRFQKNNYSSNPSSNPFIERQGFGVETNRDHALFFMELNADATDGLDLGAGAKITDLTGDDKKVYGDLMPPGRPGEELDFLQMSGDGRYVAIVRDWTTADASDFGFRGAPTFASSASNYTTGTYGNSKWAPSDDIMLIATPRAPDPDLDAGNAGDQHVLFLGTGTLNVNGSNPNFTGNYVTGRNLVNARGRKIHGLTFSKDDRKLFFSYASDNTYFPKYFGGTSGFGHNPRGTSTAWQNVVGVQMLVEFSFRTSTDGAINYRDATAGSIVKNALKDLKTIGGVGPANPPFSATNGSSQQLFWSRFTSENGDFIYYVNDVTGGRAHMWGMNISPDNVISSTLDANGNPKIRKPYDAYSLHGSGIQFEQWETNSFTYDNRFAAAPAGTVLPFTGHDGAGIVFVIASDSSVSGTAQSDLEAYVFDANRGGELIGLTDALTTGSNNAINHLYTSMDGNTLIGQRASQSFSRDSRVTLTTRNDLFAVTNVHAVLFGGATPNAFYVSTAKSHGTSVALVGEGTPTGPQAVVYSVSTKAGQQTSWDERELLISILAPSANAVNLDDTKSHYAVLAAGRKLNDNPESAD